jgi:hypothetical protein
VEAHIVVEWLKQPHMAENGTTLYAQEHTRSSRASSKRDKFMQMFSWICDE